MINDHAIVTTRATRQSAEEKVPKYWGYAALVLLIAAWWTYANGTISVAPITLILLTLVNAYYFLFQVPLPCCATTRPGQYCRNNSWGLVGACSITQHKFQKLFMLVQPWRWNDVSRRLCSRFPGALALLALMATIASGVVSVIRIIVGR
jgi:hypothetical protein